MTRMNEFNKDGVNLIRDMIKAQLVPLGKELGVTFTPGNARFSAKVATFKLEVAIGSTTREMENFKRDAHLYWLKPEDLGREFMHEETRFTITGINTRARRFPIMVVRAYDGKGFKFPEGTVRRALGDRPEPKYGGLTLVKPPTGD